MNGEFRRMEEGVKGLISICLQGPKKHTKNVVIMACLGFRI
jgi:hypothetical protein